MKTFKNWEGDLDDYLKVGDIVDKEMVNYFIDVLPPAIHTEKIIQLGEEVKGNTYSTLVKTNEGWVYVGLCFKDQTKNYRNKDWVQYCIPSL